MAEEHQSPMKATWSDPKTVICKDCIFRDKTEAKIGNRIVNVGATRSFCAAYPEPPDSNGKPMGILFHGQKCKYHTSEKAVGR